MKITKIVYGEVDKKTSNINCFRIPSLIKVDNVLLAFAEARISSSDSGYIKTVVKRSIDNGTTWSEIIVVADDSNNTLGNPCHLVDNNGNIHVFLTWNDGNVTEKEIINNHKNNNNNDKLFVNNKYRRIPYYVKSVDKGITWSKPVKLLNLTKSEWDWYATGPSNGLVYNYFDKNKNENKELWVVPCNHSECGIYYSHLVYSLDGGKNWQISESMEKYTNECGIVDITMTDHIKLSNTNMSEYSYDATFLLSMRCEYSEKRLLTIFKLEHNDIEYNLKWCETTFRHRLADDITPCICQTGLCRLNGKIKEQNNDKIYMTVPIGNSRSKLTLFSLENRLYKINEDSIWKKEGEIYDGSSGYSSLLVIDDGDMNIGCLYEIDNYNKIVFESDVLEVGDLLEWEYYWDGEIVKCSMETNGKLTKRYRLLDDSDNEYNYIELDDGYYQIKYKNNCFMCRKTDSNLVPIFDVFRSKCINIYF